MAKKNVSQTNPAVNSTYLNGQTTNPDSYRG